MGEVVQSVVAQAGGGQDTLSFVLMMGAMFAIIYFMLIRPQRKQQAEHQALLAALKKGDEVVLSGGLFGRIFAVEEQTLIVEIADRTRVKVLKSAVSTLAKTAAGSAATKALKPDADDAVPEGETAEATSGSLKKKKSK